MDILKTYFRCSDCLSVFCVNEKPETDYILCKCDGKAGFMGYVVKHPVYDLLTASACDARCTEALGNKCDCICGGENHGSGKTVTVKLIDGRYIVDEPTKKSNFSYGAEFRARLAKVESKFPELEKYKNRTFISDKGLWFTMKGIFDDICDIKNAKTKQKREKLFEHLEKLNVPEAVKLYHENCRIQNSW